MTVQIELSPNEQHQLEAVAQQHGVSIEIFLQSLVRSSLPRPLTAIQLTDAEFEQGLARLSQFSDLIPDHPGETWSRETLYDDHD